MEVAAKQKSVFILPYHQCLATVISLLVAFSYQVHVTHFFSDFNIIAKLHNQIHLFIFWYFCDSHVFLNNVLSWTAAIFPVMKCVAAGELVHLKEKNITTLKSQL